MIEQYIEHLDIDGFQRDLIQWYHSIKRDLPWRINQDPYRILVSEIMLQQTQVATVIPYYERFMKLFPTTKGLAMADDQTLLKAWEGLGYYSRARNLRESARMIEEMGGFPKTHEEILKLKGVGPYTAGAVSSIAFDIPVPAVDGNVFRVMSRVCCIYEDIAKAKTRKTFEAVVSRVISHEDPSAFNQGLMELGATICTPKSPKCLQCPVQFYCQAYHQGVDDLLPVKTKATSQTKMKLVVAVVKNQHGEYLVSKRPNTGLLANFYEFLNFEYLGEKEPKEFLVEKLSPICKKVESVQFIGTFNHVFSHRIWEMESYFISIQTGYEEVIAENDYLWISEQQMTDYPLVTAHQRILKNIES